jgi:hypothetical protein
VHLSYAKAGCNAEIFYVIKHPLSKKYLKESYIEWINSDQVSFCKGIVRKISTNRWNEMWFVDPKTKGGLIIHDLEVKKCSPPLVNVF